MTDKELKELIEDCCNEIGNKIEPLSNVKSSLYTSLKPVINYKCCCETLKDKETQTFKQWIKANGYYKKGFEWFNKHGYSRDFDKLKKYYELRDCL